jgi:hypothetical protein
MLTPDLAKAPSGANSPYKVVKVGKKFTVVNNAGETKATFKTKAAALDYQAALYANVPGAARRASKVPFTGKAKNRNPVKRKAPKVNDKAHLGVLSCPEDNCDRTFLDSARLMDHAEAVHTFNEQRALVQCALREKYSSENDPLRSPKWVYVADQADDWVVFEVEGGGDWALYKSSYSIGTDTSVTLGDAVKVVARTIYEPLPVEAAAMSAHAYADTKFPFGKCDTCGMDKAGHEAAMKKLGAKK